MFYKNKRRLFNLYVFKFFIKQNISVKHLKIIILAGALFFVFIVLNFANFKPIIYSDLILDNNNLKKNLHSLLKL